MPKPMQKKKPQLLPFAVLILSCGVCLAQSTQPAPRIRTFEVKAPTEPWKGWETGLIDEDPNPSKPPPEKYTTFPTPPGSRPSFSGKVVGLESYAGVEIGVVSVFPREYLSNGSIEWVLVRPDGTFAATSGRMLDQPKTLLVRPPGGPWTFLRHDFPVGQSGRDIELRPQPGKSILVRAQLQGGPERTWMTVEAFDGYQRRDDEGKPALSQFHGGRQSVEGRTPIILPLRPMALRVRADNSAAACVIIDPREVDEIVVKLPFESRLRAQIVKNGQFVPSKPIWIFNPLSRLTLNAAETDSQGFVQLGGLLPGPWVVMVDEERLSVVLKEGEATSVILTVTK